MKRLCITDEVHKLEGERKRETGKECDGLQHNILVSKVKAASVFPGSDYLAAFAVP